MSMEAANTFRRLWLNRTKGFQSIVNDTKVLDKVQIQLFIYTCGGRPYARLQFADRSSERKRIGAVRLAVRGDLSNGNQW